MLCRLLLLSFHCLLLCRLLLSASSRLLLRPPSLVLLLLQLHARVSSVRLAPGHVRL